MIERNDLRIYLGYDPRESSGFHTCISSIMRRSSKSVSIIPLAKNTFAWWKRTNEHDFPGSTEFSFTRFLVPLLSGYRGWAIFLDGSDMLVMDDIVKLWEMQDRNYAVMCVKHPEYTPQQSKMWNQGNRWYPRKNWSSVIMFNCGHPSNEQLTAKYVAEETGANLHRFAWLDDSEIGEIPSRWNYLAGEQEDIFDPAIIHLTLGLPTVHDYGPKLNYIFFKEQTLMNHIAPPREVISTPLSEAALMKEVSGI